ncbi:hypothetical protein DSO57_1036379 [Entomophthora muscae]|uniref:Uncharacterized protein n=1 Tax=Entomophthora muscae TaxID=34485 RepID=A0ACC2UA14_9FUNG|nr:hypothetical protein DSO57_1036379 [Entomophthora muscae]
MLTGKPQLQDSNPDTLQAGSPQIFGLEPEQDLTSGNPLKLDESKSLTLTLPTLKVPVYSTNQRAGLTIEPKITWATTEKEIKKLPIKCRPPRDDQPHDPTRKFDYSQSEPANELTPAMNATKVWKNLVNSNTQAKEICKSLPMFYFIYSLPPAVLHLTSINPKELQTYHRTFIVHQELPTAQYISLSTLPNPVYLEFILENILIYNPEARTRETETVYREGNKITIPPLLLRDKYNYLPTYLVPMTPPLTPQPNCPQKSVAANEFTSTQIFGVIFYGTSKRTLGPPGKIVILYCKVSTNLVVGSPCRSHRPSAREFPRTSRRLDPYSPPLIEFDAAVNPKTYVKELTNCIIDIQATAYLIAYKVKSLELLPSNVSRAPLPEFQVSDLVLYYQNCTGGRAHKLNFLWVGPCEDTYKKGVEYTVKLLSSRRSFSWFYAKFLLQLSTPCDQS